MRKFVSKFLFLAAFCTGGMPILEVTAQNLLPADVGTTVNGFQDDFDGTALNPNWVVNGANVFTVSSGALHVNPASGDPNHLLYAMAGYDNTVQEVLARIRILNSGAGDQVRGGVAVGVDPASSQGINYLFRNNNSEGQTGNHVSFLDDLVVWGPGQNFAWQANTWYWLRLRQEPNASSQGGVNDVFAKIWVADGTAPEPPAWQHLWDYTPAYPTRVGYAGITASSSSGLLQFDVDYILIKAAGLPSIVVAPNSFVQTPVTITNPPKSQSVTELFPVTFSVGANGNPPPTYQWYKAANIISGATNATYSVASASLSDNTAQFKVVVQNVVSNVTYAVTSSPATLTVIADTNPPLLVAAQALGSNQVQLSFSERIKLATATNTTNFSVTNTTSTLGISTATLEALQTNILLGVSAMSDGATYTVTVNNLADQSAAGNLIVPNSRTQFIASAYALAPIGNPALLGSQTAAGNGYDIVAGGSGITGTNDQGNFSYQLHTGDFDYQVRLDSFSLADAWSEAGMMAREELTAGARSISVLATPTISGAFFEFRSATNGPATLSGSFRVNYPNTWLRLKRVGNNFTGYASFDGQNWAQLGTATIAVAPTIYFGFVVTSHNTNALATAAFRDFAPVSSTGTNSPPLIESLAQCNRPTSLVISEIMYHPTNGILEFVEIFNSRGEPQDMSGYQLAGSINYTFQSGTVIPGGGFLVVARSLVDLQSAYGITGVLGPYTNNLPNSSGTVMLLSQAGALLLQVNYGSTWPWPIAPDGAGHSIVLARPSYGDDNVLAWAASDSVGGSPGRLDPVTRDPLGNVVINEFLAHTDLPDVDYVELYNHSTQPVDISGCILTDNAATNKFVIPTGTVIPGGGFVYFTETNMNFALSAAGETIYFKNPAQTRVIDAVRFEGQENGVAMGRYPDGGKQFYRLAAKTPGAANAPIRVSNIIINEIMYDPISLNDDDQYVELYNRGTSPVSLGGWQFVSGLSYTFPLNVIVQPDGYVVVARNVSRMLTNYPNLNAGNLAGNFTGKLSHHGERLVLAMPDTIVATNAIGVVQTNNILITVNEVTYGTGGRWGEWSHAGGCSLELIDPHADNSLAPNWADSDETHKAPWTVISATGTIDNGTVAADELQVLLQGNGECLLDNVQVLNSSSNNLISNSTFESGANGWVGEGTESTSSLETSEGFNSAQSYHIRAVEKGDNQINRVRTLLTSALPAGMTNVTIRAAVRWLRGTPEILLRLRGNWLECAAELPTPANPGTPGARNTKYVSNAPPAIVDVRHSPVLPAANQPIVVTACVQDPDGLSSVILNYRLDPSSTYSNVIMNDSGTSSDAVPGDGIFTATIPGQAAGTLIAFYLRAADKSASQAAATFPNDAPVRECLVRTGEVQPTGNFPVYRVWMTQAALNAVNNSSRLNNSFRDMTFVLGNQRVIYNAGGRFKGSPYISPGYCGFTCGRCGYSIAFPAGDLFLGEGEVVLDWPGGHGGETTALQEQMCYWIADRLNLPWSHRYTIRLHVNGVTDVARQTTFEAVVQPAGGFVNEWSPNDNNGQLFKIERAFEFNDAGSLVSDPQPRLQIYTTTGGTKKREKYRWYFMFRSTNRRDDYSNIFALVDAVNAPSPDPYTAATLSLVDMEEWMGIFATEHIIVNFDAYGHEIGKNMYAYLPETGKWQLYMFDLDWAMLPAPNHNSSYAPGTAPLFNAEDPTITRMYAHPPFARAYWRAIQNAVNGPFDPAVCNPVIDAKSRALFANGIQWCDGQALTDPTAVKTWFSQRRGYLQSQLATVAAPFAVNSVVVSNNVALISGTAPVGIQTLVFNGLASPLVWNNVTRWTATVVLQPGTNQISVVGLDTRGQQVSGASTNVIAVYNGTVPSPAGQVVINEIMYSPAMPNAGYVELYNTSSNISFDLSGWQLQGLAYTFPPGSLIGPKGFLVLVANRAAFAAAYGATNRVFDTFPGVLQAGGQTLTLFRSGINAAADLVVSKVRYGSAPPWPGTANGTGRSLQLIEPRQDNWRVGNWGVTNAATPGMNNSIAVNLSPFPPLWMNELQADNLTGITNGAGQRTPWLEIFNPSTNVISLSGLYLANNYSNLTAWPFPANAVIQPGEFKVIFADGQTGLSTTNELHTSFALASGSGSLALSRLYNGQPQVLDYIDYTNLTPNRAYGSFPDGQSFDRQEFIYATPGAANIATGVSSFIPYNTVGSIYSQDFDSLPNPGTTSVNAANPVTINGVTYSLANPVEFAFPVSAIGGNGGLGLPAMAGWYGQGGIGEKFGATDGDQTTGGQISFGLPRDSNRALGLLATSSTGPTAIGAKFINQTPKTLSYVSLQFTGEVWRQSNLPKTLQFYYFIDPTATASFSTARTALLPNLNVSIPVVPADVGGVPVNGNSLANQTNLSVVDQVITNWPPGAALWLVWEMADSGGKAQGFAIDNLSFTASDLSTLTPALLSIQATSTNLVISWATLFGQQYQMEYKDDLSASLWTPIGSPATGTGGSIAFTNGLNISTQRFFRLKLVP